MTLDKSSRNVSALTAVKHRNAKIAPVKRCVKAFPEINQTLLDFFFE